MVAYDANKNTNNFFLYYRALRASGQSDRSLQVLNQHLNAFPNDARAKMVLAERQIGIDTDAAIKSYREILQDFPNNFVALNNVAYVLMEKGDYDDAMEYASKAYEIQPDNIATADTYAQILVRQNKVEDAVKVYNRVMNDEVTNEEIFLNYIEALLKNGSTVIAERRMGDLTLTKPESQSRLAELRQEFQL
jgi:tetratricopeptide (TPR) repeat protein